MIGQTLAHYQVTALLGKGGMGEVYRATDTKLGRDVALKLLPPGVAHDPERLARFQREARTLAALQHPNVASVYGLESVGELTFLVMELVEGEDLSERLLRGALPVERVVEIAAQIATGLEAAHAKGIVHRDLKPANLKLGADGTVKILDFGLARAYEGDTSAVDDPSTSPTLTAAMTQAGVILGTAAYMAPEQARGRAVDHRADLWALGVITFEMLAGERLFVGETTSDTLASVLRSDIPWDRLPPALPPSLRRLLTRCLTRDPRQRQQAAGDARLELLAAANEAPTAAGRESSDQPARAGPSWRWALPLAVIVALGAGLTGRLLSPAAPVGEPAIMRLDLALCDEGELPHELGPGALLTPDGESIVFLRDLGSRRQLMVRRLDEDAARPLPGTENATMPFLSPDGQWVAFFAGNRLLKVWLGGGSPLEICAADGERARGGAWGRGDRIVFTPNTAAGLLIVDAAGGEPTPLTTLDEARAERSHRWPDFLPDGRHVVFNTQFHNRDYHDGNIEAVDVATGERHIVHRGGAFARSVDDRHLIFVRDHTVYMLEVDAQVAAQSEPLPVLADVAANTGDETIGDGSAELSVSAAGGILYGRDRARQREGRLAVVDLAGQARYLDAPSSHYFFPRVSPDGRRVVVTSFLDNRNEVWLYDLEDGPAFRLLSADGVATMGFWSSDARSIYLGYGDWSSRDIVRLDLDSRGSTVPAVVSPDDIFPQDESRDGRWIFFDRHSSDQVWEVMRGALRARGDLPVAADQFESLITSSGHPGSVRVSPDGRWLAFELLEQGSLNVQVCDLEQPSRRWLISDGGGTCASWSDDGRRLYYLSGRTMMKVDLNPGPAGLQPTPPVKLFDAPLVTMTGVWVLDKIPGRDAFLMVLEVPDDPESARKPGDVVLFLDWRRSWSVR
ncbi:MAG: protein kinase [Candidatus Krumholzibacteriia bacterium]